MTPLAISEIRLAGIRIPLRAHGDPEKAQAVLDLVNRLLQEAEPRVKEAAPHQVAILALLDLAEDYLAAKEKVAGHQKELASKSAEYFDLLKG